MYDKTNQTLTEKLEVIQNTAMRLMSGARKTSPILSLQVECNLPPLKLHRGYLTVKNHSKLLSKPENFQTTTSLLLDNYQGAYAPFNSFKYKAKEWYTTLQLPKIRRTPIPLLSPLPPWTSLLPFVTNFYNYDEINSDELFLNYISNKFPNYQFIYTDGSKTKPDPSVACAIFTPFDKRIYCWKLNSQHSVLGAELFAIDKALSYILQNMATTNTIIFTDSKTSIHLIQNHHPKTYKSIVFTIQDKLLKLNQSSNVHLHWVKGHSGIAGNEMADKAANYGHNNKRSELFPLTHSENISTIKEKYMSYWSDYWEFNSSASDKGKFLYTLRSGNLKKSSIIFDALSRREQVLLQRLRIGHAGVPAYLKRFNIISDEICINCGREPGTLKHYFLDCATFDDERYVLQQGILQLGINTFNLDTLFIGNDKPQNLSIVKLLIQYIRQTNMHNTL